MGFTTLGLPVGGGGAYLVVGTAGCAVVAGSLGERGLTTGIWGTLLVPAPASTIGI